MSYHLPVLLEASLAGLAIRPAGVYVDATFGGGGHSRRILELLGPDGRLIAFDQDPDAQANLPGDDRLIFVQHNFRFLKRFLRLHGFRQVDGILADLGVSSHQLDTARRGFSYRFEGDLDMRMNPAQELDAARVLNTYSRDALQDLFSRYGEVRNARSLADRIVEGRQAAPLQRIEAFIYLIEPIIRGHRLKYLSQVFQALRIEVNDEMGALEEFLEQALEVLKPGGRLSVISYHSIEDRLVKRFMKTGNPSGVIIKDEYGHIERPFELITRKADAPDEQEKAANPRARSARLRIAEKR